MKKLVVPALIATMLFTFMLSGCSSDKEVQQETEDISDIAVTSDNKSALSVEDDTDIVSDDDSILSDTQYDNLASSEVSNVMINLSDYIEVTFEGADGEGVARIYVDTDAINNDYAGRVELTSLAYQYGCVSIDDAVSECIIPELSKESELSNGEEIELTWDVDEASFKNFCNASLSYQNTTYTVEGLEQGTVVPEADKEEVKEIYETEIIKKADAFQTYMESAGFSINEIGSEEETEFDYTKLLVTEQYPGDNRYVMFLGNAYAPSFEKDYESQRETVVELATDGITESETHIYGADSSNYYILAKDENSFLFGWCELEYADSMDSIFTDLGYMGNSDSEINTDANYTIEDK